MTDRDSVENCRVRKITEHFRDRFRIRGIGQLLQLEESEFVNLVDRLWSEGKVEPTRLACRYKIPVDIGSRSTGETRRQIWIIVDRSNDCSLTLITVYPKDVP